MWGRNQHLDLADQLGPRGSPERRDAEVSRVDETMIVLPPLTIAMVREQVYLLCS